MYSIGYIVQKEDSSINLIELIVLNHLIYVTYLEQCLTSIILLHYYYFISILLIFDSLWTNLNIDN